jgi:hypothetical protein
MEKHYCHKCQKEQDAIVDQKKTVVFKKASRGTLKITTTEYLPRCVECKSVMFELLPSHEPSVFKENATADDLKNEAKRIADANAAFVPLEPVKFTPTPKVVPEKIKVGKKVFASAKKKSATSKPKKKTPLTKTKPAKRKEKSHA